MSTVPADDVAAVASEYAQRISRNDAALARYCAERAERGARAASTRAERRARAASTRSSERVIARLEVETTLLRAWAERDAALAR